MQIEREILKTLQSIDSTLKRIENKSPEIELAISGEVSDAYTNNLVIKDGKERKRVGRIT